MSESGPCRKHYRVSGHCRHCDRGVASFVMQKTEPSGAWIRCSGGCERIVWACSVEFADLEGNTDTAGEQA